jgi:bifunctional UDP-N-acetylglucosamine pyrophosphorylase/glucosamine-1-phosphate N-acetyltransferase
MNIVILAAGQGKRMNSALPKVLHPVGGRPLLHHVLTTALQLQPQRIVVVIGHGGEQVQASIETAFADQRERIHCVTQTEQLGTGHAVQQALPLLAEEPYASQATLILYGDVPLTRLETLQALVNLPCESNLAFLQLLTVNLANPTGYGRIVRDAATQHVLAIVEEKDCTTEQRQMTEGNTGILCLPTALLHRYLPQLSNRNAQGEYYLTDVIAMAVAQGVVIQTHQPHDEWETLGVNNRQQQAELECHYQHAQAVSLMQAGVTLLDPQRIDVRGSLQCGRDVVIDVNCIFEGCVVLGDGVEIGANCILRDVTVGAGSQIHPFSHLVESQIGAACEIGPYARLRPATQLADHCKVGNFVEMKKTTLGAGSKVNHLSYIGDATVGQAVNIGAGTITCNYDGVNKYQTIIEDGAFIGSDTQLVAPVRIGQNATIGAGSTITKDTPADQLTLSRSKQTSVAGWKRPEKIEV